MALKKNNVINEHSDKPISKKSSHYVSNTDLYNEFIIWHQDRKDAEAMSKPEPKIPEAIGKGIMQIAENFSKKFNWSSNARYREELSGDAIVNCILYVRNFNPEKSKNPFSYFTQISYFAFLRRIDREKISDYIKHKSLMNSKIYQDIQSGDFNDDDFVLEDLDYDSTGVDDFIQSFELKMFNKKLDTDEIAGIGGKTRRLDGKSDIGFL